MVDKLCLEVDCFCTARCHARLELGHGNSMDRIGDSKEGSLCDTVDILD